MRVSEGENRKKAWHRGEGGEALTTVVGVTWSNIMLSWEWEWFRRISRRRPRLRRQLLVICQQLNVNNEQPNQRHCYRSSTYRLARSTAYQLPSTSPRAIMSNVPSSSTSRSNLDAIFHAALKSYKKKTGKDITSHPLASELQSCDSPDAILAVLRRQIPTPDRSQNGDETFAKYLVPTVNVLYTLSGTLGEGISLVIITIIPDENLCSNVSLSGFLAIKSNIYWYRCSPLGRLSFIRGVSHFDLWRF
jgi:hypothetical protein